ncbi:MAG TPA: class I SAM-dependent methyltransferase [Gaiellaceae bacterium]|nr:class I SAM-dependent methyltransferase [Gaiellaceae bacterium]
MKLADLERSLGRRVARMTTNAVVARPRLWGALRWLTRAQFDRLAPVWDSMRRPEAFAALERALETLPAAPKRVLDLGTGTGLAAFVAAQRFPEAEVVGIDLAPGMVEQASQRTPPELAGRVRFEQGDAARLPFEDGAFDLVQLANMIPFFDELARVTAPGGHLVLSFSAGPETPIWVPPERLRRELGVHGFTDFADFEAEGATALLARRADRL